MNALTIQNLTKSYNGTPAVDDLSFTIKKGEFFGFLGPNGAGKSTTIHCITGVSRFSQGTIELFGHDVQDEYRVARSKVGLAPQEFNAEIFAPVEHILDYAGGYYGMRKAERKERVDELLGQFSMEDHRKKQFRQLSGGMKRRVMLMRALMHDPDLLILDEPTAGVDVELRRELHDRLRMLNEQGKTILLTSHYLEEVELLCDRVAIMNKGKLVLVDDKEEIVKNERLEERYLEMTKA